MSDKEPPEHETRWTRLWKLPRKWYFFHLPLGAFAAFFVGIVLWASFERVVEASSTESFCISCHEMRDNVYMEYTSTVHFSNRTGVRAICADCHVPKAFVPKMLKKIGATVNEVPHWLLGTIATREKFEAHRIELARSVWKELKANDSRPCRECHELPHMNLEVQARSARSKHTVEREKERGETCIDCHQGIAHHLPEGWEDVSLE